MVIKVCFLVLSAPRQTALVAGTILLEEQGLCSVSRDVFCTGACVFAVDKQAAAKCGLVARGLGQPLFFPHRRFLDKWEEVRLVSSHHSQEFFP